MDFDSSKRRFDSSYELIELCPVLFRNIRKIHDVEDVDVKSVFTLSNILNLDIRISGGKGGSFFIEPIDGGRMMIKSITKPEYEIIKDTMSDYYCYQLMNPHTYLSPILGVYKLKLQENESVAPICFMLMKNVLPIDPKKLSPEDMVLTFDMKGSIAG